jgi:hypothetical protein
MHNLSRRQLGSSIYIIHFGIFKKPLPVKLSHDIIRRLAIGPKSSSEPQLVLSALNSRTCLFLWKRGETQVWLYDAEVRENFLGLVVLDRGVDNHIITWYPVDGSSDAVLVASL